MTDTGELKKLPLEHLHNEAGAKFGAFAGWSMPLTYPLGVMKEHLHCREAAGLFDISHMRLFVVFGMQAASFISRVCPVVGDELAIGGAKYTFLLSDDAGILDDLIVTRTGERRFVVVANAGNADADERHLRNILKEFDAKIESFSRAFLAVQGPKAEKAVNASGVDASDLRFMQGREPKPGWFISRTGYTGEDGFEIALPVDEAEAFTRTLLANEDVEWVGLAARDSLRLEAGLCLHGQDITSQTTPVEAALLWAIPKKLRSEGTYVGAQALARATANPAKRRRVGLRPENRQPVRAGATIVDAAGDTVGEVTSGGFGPSLGAPVAMGYVDVSALDAPLFAEVRGNKLPLALAALPFHPHRTRKG